MAVNSYNQCKHCYVIIKSIVLLSLLFSFVTSSSAHTFSVREKRGTPRIEDLPQIRPPKLLKKGEAKYPSPGWTHCIIYLKADVRWRSIRSVNMKRLQATQFQCTWFIESQIPDSQLRISFEKVDLGNSDLCMQQFLELIDVAVGKSQGRFCGKGKINDYVTVGQRARIDIHGEEELVEKVRGNKEPFVISYKIVKETPGFRISQQKGDIALRNKVKISVGSTMEKGKTVQNTYGPNNQPGQKRKSEEEESSSSANLPIWQIIIIIFICIAFVGVVIGVIIKRMVFDKKKKEEYLEYQMEQGLVTFPGKSAEDIKKPLPGLVLGSSRESEKKSKYWKDENMEDNRKMNRYENIGVRSTSKPEQTMLNKVEKIKRSNSHGDIGSPRMKGAKGVAEMKQEAIGDEEILTPASRAPRAPKPRTRSQKKGSEVVSPSSRARKTNQADGDLRKNKRKSERTTRKARADGEKKKKRTRDVNANDVKKHKSDVIKSNGDKNSLSPSKSRSVPQKTHNETSKLDEKRSKEQRNRKTGKTGIDKQKREKPRSDGDAKKREGEGLKERRKKEENVDDKVKEEEKELRRKRRKERRERREEGKVIPETKKSGTSHPETKKSGTANPEGKKTGIIKPETKKRDEKEKIAKKRKTVSSAGKRTSRKTHPSSKIRNSAEKKQGTNEGKKRDGERKEKGGTEQRKRRNKEQSTKDAV